MPSVETALACKRCAKICFSENSLSMHMVSSHQAKDDVHQCVNTIWCPVCGIIYANRDLLMQHILENPQICKMNLLLRGSVYPKEEIDRLENQQSVIRAANRKAGLPRFFASRPAVRAFGPFLPIVGLNDDRIFST